MALGVRAGDVMVIKYIDFFSVSETVECDENRS